MDNVPQTQAEAKKLCQNMLNTAIAVITNPVEFFRGMAKTGGFVEPLIFMVATGVISGVIRAVLGLFHFGMVGSTMAALASIILVPIFVLIFGFVGAAILFGIWKLMGSNESYETAYRCGAYASAISPILAVLGIIPYVGGLIGLAWMLFLLVNASVEVHKIAAKTAWMVFGIITAILALMSTCGEISARRMQRQMGSWQREFGNSGSTTTPDDAAKISAAMMQAMQAEMAKQAKEAKEAEKPADE
jgi:hypothetical protein